MTLKGRIKLSVRIFGRKEIRVIQRKSKNQSFTIGMGFSKNLLHFIEAFANVSNCPSSLKAVGMLQSMHNPIPRMAVAAVENPPKFTAKNPIKKANKAGL